jgi:hypothetical protein
MELLIDPMNMDRAAGRLEDHGARKQDQPGCYSNGPTGRVFLSFQVLTKFTQ